LFQESKHILAFNSSPRKEKGFTDMVLRRFLAGAEAEGADTEVVYLAEKKIADCVGCTYCWFKTPGTCFQKDDMGMLLPKIASADVLVAATPLYVDGMSGPLKNFFDLA
jgi:multimeric flavodoxin WrbA